MARTHRPDRYAARNQAHILKHPRTRWSLRGREGGHNVAFTATIFQGGEHAAAAGFSIQTPREPIVI